MFTFPLFSTEAMAGICTLQGSKENLHVAYSCGFGMLPGVKPSNDTLYSNGQLLCKDNKKLFINIPCYLHISSKDKNKTCVSQLVYEGRVYIRDSVFDDTRDGEDQSICKLDIR